MTPPSPPPTGGLNLRDDLLNDARAELASLDRAAGGAPPPCREVYAACHVVMQDAYVAVESNPPDSVSDWIDWEATATIRRRLAGHGFGIAEAMDTAQRYELGWECALRLIEGCGAMRLSYGFVAGASTDHLADCQDPDALAQAWAWQANQILAAGGTPVLLPQPQLTAWRYDADAFVDCYRRVLDAVDGPLLLHWLGEMFHPAMRGYFPDDSLRRVLALDTDKVRGVKLSLLDARFERKLRRDLKDSGQCVFTGDDFHFADLIGGDTGYRGERAVPSDADGCFSHALLGIFDAIAAPAGLALRFLAHQRRDAYDRLMAPCEALGQAVFESPTQDYKAGLAWIAWLNDWQSNPMLVHHHERTRDHEHLLRITQLASDAGCLDNADLASRRCAKWCKR